VACSLGVMDLMGSIDDKEFITQLIFSTPQEAPLSVKLVNKKISLKV
jgi:hypothetical protein